MANQNVSVPSWEKELAPIHTHPLTPSRKADVCVIGAGIAGLTTAYLLAREGYSVVVLERDGIGSGETGRTTAQASNVLGTRYFELADLHGCEGARLIADSHLNAAHQIERISRAEKIDCDLERVDGYLVLSPQHDLDYLRKEYKAVTKAGIRAEWIDYSPITRLSTGPWIKFPDQVQFHPMKYLAGLKTAIERLGGEIFTDTDVTDILGESCLEVRTRHLGSVVADKVVVATNTPVFNKVTMHTKQAAYRTYVIGIEVNGEELPRALYWDTEDAYHYVRYEKRASGASILLVGGEDHKVGQLADNVNPWQKLEGWARRHIPGTLGNVRYRWSGQVEEPVDGIGFAGLNPGVHRNHYLITGDAGNGITHGTIGARIITDHIAGRENAWSSLYSPGRVRVKSSLDFMRENANTFAQYRDLITAKPHDAATIAREEGRILRHGVSPVAAYRDAHGKLHECSAICPHLGAVLRWNGLEKTWDCPAHGSRFTPDGEVLNGPANCPLHAAEKSAPQKKSAAAPKVPRPGNFPDHASEADADQLLEATAGLRQSPPREPDAKSAR